MPAVANFKPSQNALRFRNGPWPAAANLELNIAGLPRERLDSTKFGLCGGMCFTTQDAFESGLPQLSFSHSSTVPVPIVHYIMRRLIDSFNGPGLISKWLAWTQTPDHDTVVWGQGVFGRTLLECPAIRADIDANMLCPIGLVLEESSWPWAVFDNHVVLVYAYELDGTKLTLHVYDCNRVTDRQFDIPGDIRARDDITIALDTSAPVPAKEIETNGSVGSTGILRGFFRIPYAHVDASPIYQPFVSAGPVVSGSPAVTSWGPGRLDFFAIGTDGHLYQRAWTGAEFGDWVNLGGAFTGSPAVTSWGPGRLDFFAIGTDGHLYQRAWTGAEFGDWFDLTSG
jgi:hypothetical protein